MLQRRIFNIETIKYRGRKVKVSGWVNKIRSHGKIIFIDLRDYSGILQLVFTPKNESLYKIAQKLKPEWVIEVEGKIKERPKEMINSKIETGKIELLAEKIEILAKKEKKKAVNIVVKKIKMPPSRGTRVSRSL